MKKGSHHSKESIEKNRVSHLGKRHSEKTKKLLSDIFKGRPHTEEHIKRVGDALRGRHHTEEALKNIRRANRRVFKGKSHTEEHNENVSIGALKDERRVKYWNGARYYLGGSHRYYRCGTQGPLLSHEVWNYIHSKDFRKSGEPVHHLDVNQLNDHPSNLLKLESESAHQILHHKIRKNKKAGMFPRTISFIGWGKEFDVLFDTYTKGRNQL